MQLGVIVPTMNPRDLAALAAEAETAGWDGVFVWDPLIEDNVWIGLGAAALVTERIRLGTMLTPVSRRRPWELAQEVATVDRTANAT